MEAILTRCGYRCDLCLAYKPNVLGNPSNRQKLSDGWFKYFGFRLPAAEICCDGCMSDNPKLVDSACPVRPCVIEKGLDNCSQCEQYVCEKLGLQPAPISTQILQRDRHAEFMTSLALAASSLETYATEIRHLQKTEVLEAEEFFSRSQKGSSAMPHKRNPITCERVAGLARVLRGNAQTAMENIALWHERDITHSSVERIVIPDSCILLDYMTATLTDIIEKLMVYPENMKKNLDLTHGLIFSQAVLLALTNRGMKREDAYAAVQKHAMSVWESKNDFKDVLKADPTIRTYLKDGELDELFDAKKSVRHVDAIFERVGLA